MSSDELKLKLTQTDIKNTLTLYPIRPSLSATRLPGARASHYATPRSTGGTKDLDTE